MIDFSKFENLSKTAKSYLINSFLALIVLFSIMLMFFIQFKVDNLRDKVVAVDAEISSLDDEIRVLEVEWVYLTRPERLRELSTRYLQNNGYIASIQVKDSAALEKYYMANLRRRENVAMNENNNSSTQ